MSTDTGKVTDISIGSESIETPTLASESEKAASPSTPAPMKSVSDNSCETLAELLSLIQEDCRRYSQTLAEFLPVSQKAVVMHFNGDGLIFLSNPPGHKLGFEGGHILLDEKPVTGWHPE